MNASLPTSVRTCLWICLISLLLTGCGTYTRPSNINISQSYIQDPERPDMLFRIHVVSETSAVVYARIPAEHLAMLNPVGDKTPVLRWGLFSGFESNHPVDTGRFRFPGTSIPDGVFMMFSDTLHFNGSNEYSFHCRLISSIGKEYEYMTVFHHDNWGSPDMVLARDGNNSVRFRNYAVAGDTVRFDIQTWPANESLEIELFRLKADPALPPFLASQKQAGEASPDTSFRLMNRTLIPWETGIYRIILKKDIDKVYGFTMPVFENGFPYITSPEQMLESTRYIMTRKEYQECMEANDIKEAIDDFWLSVCGSITRARKQMARYYEGVETANRLFTTHTEGWKTDRGMMYIVLGRPDMVYRSEDSEHWMYGEAGYIRSINLLFNRTRSPFQTDVYTLERLPTLKESWYYSVSNWRR